MALSYVGIGSNLGDSAATIGRAVKAMERFACVLRRSLLYRSAPWGKTDQPPFLNAVVLLETKLAPAELLAALKALEVTMGRIPSERWGPRAIDLDILTYDDATIDEPDLRVPHRHLAERAFVLVPLAAIDEQFVPMRDALSPQDLAGVVRV